MQECRAVADQIATGAVNSGDSAAGVPPFDRHGAAPAMLLWQVVAVPALRPVGIRCRTNSRDAAVN